MSIQRSISRATASGLLVAAAVCAWILTASATFGQGGMGGGGMGGGGMGGGGMGGGRGGGKGGGEVAAARNTATPSPTIITAPFRRRRPS